MDSKDNVERVTAESLSKAIMNNLYFREARVPDIRHSVP